jgi:heme A synthase
VASGRRSHVWLWGAGAFLAGYAVTLATRNPSYGTAGAVAVAILFAARADNPRRSMLRGLGMGLAGSVGIAAALSASAPALAPQALGAVALAASAATVTCCLAAACLFAWLRQRRSRQ